MTQSGDVLFTGDDITRGQELFQAAGCKSTARSSATAPTSGRTTPPTTCAGPPTTSTHSSGPRASPSLGTGWSRNSAPTATTTPPRRWSSPTPGRGIREHQRHYADLLRRELHQVRAVAEADHRPSGDPRPDRVLRLDGVGGRGRASRSQLHLHQQLARRAASGQRPDRTADRLVGAVTDRAARRHRHHVRRLRPLEPKDRLAQRGGADAVLPSARRGDAHTARSGRPSGSSRSCRCCSWPRPCSGAAAQHYRADLATFLRPRSGRDPALQPGPHLARATGPVLDGRGLPRRRHLPHPVHRPARAATPAAGWPTACSAPSSWWSSAR